VPYQLTGRALEVRATAATVGVLHRSVRVASHARSHLPYQATTIAERRPRAHQKHLEWTPSRLIHSAAGVGPSTAAVVERILAGKPHPETGFRSCLGIFRLAEQYSSEPVEAAAQRALARNACAYQSLESMLERGLDRLLGRSLTAESAWVCEHQNVFLLGPAGIGKTWLARAFGQKACRDGYTAYFTKATALFRDLGMAQAEGSLGKLLYRLSRVDVLIVGDWAMAPLAEGERREFLEICDRRSQTRSTLLTGQLPVAAWHAQIGDPTVADRILDRLVHHAHRFELKGESLRKRRVAKPPGKQ